MPDNPPTRQAANVFLDAAQVFQFGGGAVDLAMQQLLHIGAITVDVDIENENVDLELSAVVLGALAIINPLLNITATNWGLSVEETIERLRDLIDQNLE